MLALIAGQGAVPELIAKAWPEAIICELEGNPSGLPDPLRFRVETLGTLVAELKARGATEVCFAGGIQRPSLDPGRIDKATQPLVPRILAALQMGDDGALRVVLEIFEEHGMVVRPAHDLLPFLIPDVGVPTNASPQTRDVSDADRAQRIMTHIASADIGQACVVAAGQALAIEAVGGTDWMLRSLAGSSRPSGPDGGILFKAAKANQDRRVDMPTIGVDTVEEVFRAGLSGIVLSAGDVMVVDLPAVVAACNRRGLFLWVRE